MQTANHNATSAIKLIAMFQWSSMQLQAMMQLSTMIKLQAMIRLLTT